LKQEINDIPASQLDELSDALPFKTVCLINDGELFPIAIASESSMRIDNLEQLHNPNFKPLEFEGFKNEASSNRFFMPPKKWVETTRAIGIFSKSGRCGGGTYAHKDIAFIPSSLL
jgi:hypothetical protein